MKKGEAIKYLQQLYPNGGHRWLDEQRIKAIGMAINALQEELVSEGLEEAASMFAREDSCGIENPANFYYIVADKARIFKAGAQWQKEHLWKPADGNDLPEIDREVIVLVRYNAQHNIHDEEYPTYRVQFGHRHNPDGWDGKNIDTNEVTHYTPKLYDKGGWNAPDIAYWLDYDINELLCR